MNISIFLFIYQQLNHNGGDMVLTRRETIRSAASRGSPFPAGHSLGHAPDLRLPKQMPQYHDYVVITEMMGDVMRHIFSLLLCSRRGHITIYVDGAP